MAKRNTGVGKMKTTKSHKTKKRLEAKKVMLEVAKTRRNSRHYEGK